MPNKNKTEYPDELTCDQMERYNIFKIFQDAEKASLYAKKSRGQIYTQVDGDENVIYSKGVHYVNRTSRYAVIKS